MELISVVEFVCLVLTLVMFSTGLPPCLKMYKTGNTKNIPYLTFLLSVISCFSMCHYAVLVDNSTVLFINAVGVVMQALYVCLYLLSSCSKMQPVLYLTACLTYVISLYTYLYMVVIDTGTIAQILGSTSGLITSVLMCLPILEVVQNIRHKNTDGTPPIMLYGGVVCCFSWLIYGLMLGDANIYSPNIPGILVILAKLTVLNLYSSSAKEKTS